MEFVEQAKLQISALNVMTIYVSRHIYVSKQKALLEKHQTGIRVENSLDQDQVRRFVRVWSGSKLFAKVISRRH